MSHNLGHLRFLFVEPHVCLCTSKISQHLLKEKKNQHTGTLTEERVIHCLISPALAFRGECQVRKHLSTSSTFLLKTALYPRASSHPTRRRLLQEVCSDLNRPHWEASKPREWIWQPTCKMEKRVLTAQFPARKNVSCILSQGSTYHPWKTKKKVIWACLDYFHFQTVLGRRMGEFHWPELTFNFFHVFLIFLPWLRIHPQLQTSENTQDLSAATDLRDEAVMEIHLETVHFQVRWGECILKEKRKTLLPLHKQTVFQNSLSEHA